MGGHMKMQVKDLQLAIVLREPWKCRLPTKLTVVHADGSLLKFQLVHRSFVLLDLLKEGDHILMIGIERRKTLEVFQGTDASATRGLLYGRCGHFRWFVDVCGGEW